MSDDKSSNSGCGAIGLIGAIVTSIVGHAIHGSIFWAIMDLFFWPFAWCKWLMMQQVNLSIIKRAFAFFLQ